MLQNRVNTQPRSASAGLDFKASNIALLTTLSLVYGAQYLDQIILGMFLQPIKAEYLLSDTQAGLLTGVAFTMLFVSLGIPVARLADRGNRKLIVVASTTIFSLATIFCGLSVGFISLFLMRMLVAIGEAGTIPASVSILSDVFPPARRRLALSFHSCGSYFGTAIGLLFVGLASPFVGWRQIFGVVGGVGLLLALAVVLFVREPERSAEAQVTNSLLQDVKALVAIRPFLFLALALGFISTSSSAAINWIPAFLARSHGMDQRHILLFLAAVWGLGATSGSVASGFVTNWVYRKGGKWPLIVVGCLAVVFPLLCCAAFLATKAVVSLIVFACAIFAMGGIRGPSFAAVQDIVPAHCRATANSFLMFTMYAIGFTFGPLLTGAFSDIFAASLGTEALRYALLVVIASAGVVGAIFVALAAVTIGRVSPRVVS